MPTAWTGSWVPARGMSQNAPTAHGTTQPLPDALTVLDVSSKWKPQRSRWSSKALPISCCSVSLPPSANSVTASRTSRMSRGAWYLALKAWSESSSSANPAAGTFEPSAWTSDHSDPATAVSLYWARCSWPAGGIAASWSVAFSRATAGLALRSTRTVHPSVSCGLPWPSAAKKFAKPSDHGSAGLSGWVVSKPWLPKASGGLATYLWTWCAYSCSNGNAAHSSRRP